MNKTFLQMQEIINLSEVNQWLLSFYPPIKNELSLQWFCQKMSRIAGFKVPHQVLVQKNNRHS